MAFSLHMHIFLKSAFIMIVSPYSKLSLSYLILLDFTGADYHIKLSRYYHYQRNPYHDTFTIKGLMS